jgi:hypothetical protein
MEMSSAFAVHYETVSLARKIVLVDRSLTRNLVRSRTDRSGALFIFYLFYILKVFLKEGMLQKDLISGVASNPYPLPIISELLRLVALTRSTNFITSPTSKYTSPRKPLMAPSDVQF